MRGQCERPALLSSHSPESEKGISSLFLTPSQQATPPSSLQCAPKNTNSALSSLQQQRHQQPLPQWENLQSSPARLRRLPLGGNLGGGMSSVCSAGLPCGVSCLSCRTNPQRSSYPAVRGSPRPVHSAPAAAAQAQNGQSLRCSSSSTLQATDIPFSSDVDCYLLLAGD